MVGLTDPVTSTERDYIVLHSPNCERNVYIVQATVLAVHKGVACLTFFFWLLKYIYGT